MILLAGSLSHARRYAQKHDIPDNKWLQCDQPYQLRGIVGPLMGGKIKLILLDDAQDILSKEFFDTARARGFLH